MIDLFTHAECAALRDQAIALHEKTDDGKHWLDRARLHARAIAVRQGKVTADDVRASCGDPPASCDGRIMGAVFQRMLFERVGFVQSRRGINHAKNIAVFKLKDSPVPV